MEMDDEVKGEGNSYDFRARMYDPRVGRWFSTDAFESKHASISPYVFALNNPIYFIDPDGNDILPSTAFMASVYGPLLTKLRSGSKTFEEMLKPYKEKKLDLILTIQK